MPRSDTTNKLSWYLMLAIIWLDDSLVTPEASRDRGFWSYLGSCATSSIFKIQCSLHTFIYGPYIDIIADLGGGLKALDVCDPLLTFHDYILRNLHPDYFKYSDEKNVKEDMGRGVEDFHTRLEYARLFSWAREVSLLITHPELVSRSTCSFKNQSSEINITYEHEKF